jgi:N-acetylglucosaminyltransferase
VRRMSEKRLSIAILIPCHNEEAMIAACIDSCLSQSRPPDQIVVVNDGSTDKSGSILKRYGERITVVETKRATGNKSYAQEIGLQHVTTDIFVATDGDTVLHPQFLLYVEENFQENPELAAVCGYVRSMRCNLFTAFREIDYVIGQDIHKAAQSCLNFLMVIPGCAGAFRTNIFHSAIGFDHDTLTEDLDFTYKLHRAGLTIKWEPRAVVYTQDPATLSSYINQMRRWYCGGWQNLRKHVRAFERPNSAFELSLTYLDGFLFATLFWVLPFINLLFFAQLILTHIGIFVLLGTYAALKRRRWDLFYFSWASPLLIAVNNWIFLEQFIKEIVLRKTNLIWYHPKRHTLHSSLHS